MKGFIQRHVWLSAVVGFVLALAMGGSAVMAATSWQSSQMTAVIGTINVVTPTGNFDYSLSSHQIDFGTQSVNKGASFSITSAPITITNTGDQPINLLLMSSSGQPTGIQSYGFTLNPTLATDGSGGTFAITFHGIAAATPCAMGFANVNITITPN
jgi:hypothetical protein